MNNLTLSEDMKRLTARVVGEAWQAIRDGRARLLARTYPPTKANDGVTLEVPLPSRYRDAEFTKNLDANILAMHHDIERLTQENDWLRRHPSRVLLTVGVVEALTAARDVLMTRCACPSIRAGRGLALDAINRELKAAGYVWQQTADGPILTRARNEEQRRQGRSSVDPHAGMNPTITERRTEPRS